jgi:hypothetical protein
MLQKKVNDDKYFETEGVLASSAHMCWANPLLICTIDLFCKKSTPSRFVRLIRSERKILQETSIT